MLTTSKSYSVQMMGNWVGVGEIADSLISCSLRTEKPSCVGSEA